MNPFLVFWRWLLSLFYKKELKITIIGPPNAGKTTFVNAISGKDTEIENTPTIGVKTSSVRIGNVEFSIHDAGGHPSYRYLWKINCNSSDVILYVLDCADQEMIATSESQLESLFSDSELVDKPILIIANKIDLPEAMTQNDIIARLRLQEIEGRVIKLFCISAKKRINVDNIMNWIIDNL